MAPVSVLRIAVLTTDTLHHRYFLRRLWKETQPDASVVLNLFEQKPYPWTKNARSHFRRHFPDAWHGLVLNPYLQPNLASRLEAFERPHFFPDGNIDLPTKLRSRSVYSVNGADARQALKDAEPDLILVYGTGLVKTETFALARICAINAHGGKIPGYRGLDTNLWAAYEGHPNDMTVTLHQVDENLDTGPIFIERQIGPVPGLSLYSLRYHTAVACTHMFVELIGRFLREVPTPRTQDGSRSRYYGPMPWLLKLKTDRILRTYAAKTPGGNSGV